MKVKCRRFILLIMSLILAFSACSQQSKAPTEVDTQLGTIKNTQAQETGTIKLYIYEEDSMHPKLFNQAMNMFNIDYPEVQFEQVGIKDFEEYTKRLSTELMAGEGPDVIMFQPYMSLSLRKIMDMGALADLDEFIKNDPEFKIDNYNKVVMDSGLYQGKRYVIPLFYSVTAFLTTEGLLSRNGFYPGQWTLDDLEKQISNLRSNNWTGENNVYFHLNYWVSLFDLIYSSRQKFIDYERRKTYLDTPEFIRLLKLFKTIQEVKLPNEVFFKYGNYVYEVMKNNQLLIFSTPGLLDPKCLWKEANYINYYLDGQAKLYPFPAVNGDQNYNATPEYLIAMNQQCQNKQLAYEFIKTFLSEEIQSGDIVVRVPVNKAAFEKLLVKYAGEQGEGESIKPYGKSVQFSSSPLPSSLVEDLRNIISNITTCEIQDSILSSMISEELSGFLEGKCTAEEAAKAMERKVQLYLNE